MAKNERLNEEAPKNNNTPPILPSDDMVYLNKLNDEEKQLPKVDHLDNKRKA